jgi:hypothetical protein
VRRLLAAPLTVERVDTLKLGSLASGGPRFAGAKFSPILEKVIRANTPSDFGESPPILPAPADAHAQVLTSTSAPPAPTRSSKSS